MTPNEPTISANSGLRDASAIALWNAMSCSIAFVGPRETTCASPRRGARSSCASASEPAQRRERDGAHLDRAAHVVDLLDRRLVGVHGVVEHEPEHAPCRSSPTRARRPFPRSRTPSAASARKASRTTVRETPSSLRRDPASEGMGSPTRRRSRRMRSLIARMAVSTRPSPAIFCAAACNAPITYQAAKAHLVCNQRRERLSSTR